MKGLILVKLGGSSITDIEKPNVARHDVIKRLANEVKSASANKKIILGHGSGSFGHVLAKKYRTHEGLINEDSLLGAALTQNVAAQLHRIVIDEFCNAGINALSFPPSSNAITKNRKITHWNVRPIKHALKNGFLPVTCGDVVLDSELGVTIASTEEAFSYLAKKLKPEKIILGGDTDGVFTANPKLVKDAKLIEEINSSNIDEALRGAGASTKVDVTGGMKTKLEYAYNIAKLYNTKCQIVNINVPGRLHSAIIGEKILGTVIKA